jgi:hypothetical protein
MRRVFFSFEYGDVSRAMTVRNSWVTQGREAAGFVDAAAFEQLERQGKEAIQRWINSQLNGTSVTAVLVGSRTCASSWVRYEIDRSKALGHGLLGVDISKIRDFHGNTTDLCGKIPTGYSFYRWNTDDGYKNLGSWIEAAARAAGR